MTTLNIEAVLVGLANVALNNRFEQTALYIGNNKSVIAYEGNNFMNFLVESRAFKEDFINFIGKPMWMHDFLTCTKGNEMFDSGKPGEDNFHWWILMYHNSLDTRTPEQWYEFYREHCAEVSKRMFG